MDHLELKEFLVHRFAKQYALNDKAHQIDHVVDVCDRALRINDEYGLGLDPKQIVISAICHDIFTWSRNNHHHLAKEYLLTTSEQWILGFSDAERRDMAMAALEHRASWKGGYSSMLSELIATADRGEPGNIEEKVRRCYLYGVDKLKQSPEDAIARIIPHLLEKYCADGYGNNPPLYYRVYGERLADMRQTIMSLDHNSKIIKDLMEVENDI